MKTVQVDISNDIEIGFDKKDYFQSLIWAQCETLSLKFNDYLQGKNPF